MNMDQFITILLGSTLMSTLMSTLISTLILEPFREKKKYRFDEKKRVYDSIIVFCQVYLYPEEARYSLGVARYDIRCLSIKDMKSNALHDIKMSIPKVKMITENRKIIKCIEEFICYKNEDKFEAIVSCFQKDLYR